MGYGKRALQQLITYYEGKIPNISEDVQTADSGLQNGDTLNEVEDFFSILSLIQPYWITGFTVVRKLWIGKEATVFKYHIAHKHTQTAFAFLYSDSSVRPVHGFVSSASLYPLPSCSLNPTLSSFSTTSFNHLSGHPFPPVPAIFIVKTWYEFSYRPLTCWKNVLNQGKICLLCCKNSVRGQQKSWTILASVMAWPLNFLGELVTV